MGTIQESSERRLSRNRTPQNQPANDRVQNRDSPELQGSGFAPSVFPGRCTRQPRTSLLPRREMCRVNRKTRFQAAQRTSRHAAPSPASSGRSSAGPRIPHPTCREHIQFGIAPEPAWCSARRTNTPSSRAAGSAPVPTPRADSACAHHRNPSSILQCHLPTAGHPSPDSPGWQSFSSAGHRKSSHVRDNYFAYPAFYVNETTPLSLHFGELRLPVFMRLASHPITTKRCHPERSSHFAKRNDVESKDPVSAGKRTQRRNEFSPRLTRLFSSSPTASSAPEFLCRHASLPIGTEAGSALRCPACY